MILRHSLFRLLFVLNYHSGNLPSHSYITKTLNSLRRNLACADEDSKYGRAKTPYRLCWRILRDVSIKSVRDWMIRRQLVIDYCRVDSSELLARKKILQADIGPRAEIDLAAKAYQ
jgi:hypothetical protein